MFRDFDEAARSAPSGVPIGYDNVEAASFYRDLLGQFRHDDYPAILWLTQALGSSQTLLEIGGHVGVAYYTFERLVGLPEGFTWTILDTPTVADAGRQLARERGRGNIRFISDFDEVDDRIDILFAAGSLQYVPGPLLPVRLSRMGHPPRHVLINKTPVTDHEGFVTLQNLGVAYCPYRVHARGQLIDPLLAMGYEIVDSWQKDRRLIVKGHPERTLEHYSGFYLRHPAKE